MADKSITVRVECYAGYRGEETPRSFHLNDRKVTIAEVVDLWLAPDHRYFKVCDTDGDLYILRHDVTKNGWEMTMFERGGCANLPPGEGRA